MSNVDELPALPMFRFSRELSDAEFKVLPLRFRDAGIPVQVWDGSRVSRNAWLNRFWWQYFDLVDECTLLRDIVDHEVEVGASDCLGSFERDRMLRNQIVGASDSLVWRLRDMMRCVGRINHDDFVFPSELNGNAAGDIGWDNDGSWRLVALITEHENTVATWRLIYSRLRAHDLRTDLEERRAPFVRFLSGKVLDDLCGRLRGAAGFLHQAVVADVEHRRSILNRSEPGTKSMRANFVASPPPPVPDPPS